MFSKPFEVKYVFRFKKAKAEEIGADFRVFSFSLEAKPAIDKRHICVAKTM